MTKDPRPLSKKMFAQVSELPASDREILECQDHWWRIYSNEIDAVLETPAFESEADAKAYIYKSTDLWHFADDVNW